jgi:hypothetical protein
MVLPQDCRLVFEDSLVLAEHQLAIRDYVSAHVTPPDRPLSTADEIAHAADHAPDYVHDPWYRELLGRFDRALSRHRAARGAAFKNEHAPHIQRVLSTFAAQNVEVRSVDPLSGAVFLDADRYSADQIRSLLPGAVVELYEEGTNFCVFANAETRVGWLHQRGITGGGGADPDTLAFDYLCVDTGLDTTVTDIVSGHRILANTDPTFWNPYSPGPTYHGTRVCGVVTSDNSTARGVTPELDAVFVTNNRVSAHISTTEQEVRGYSWGMSHTDSLFGDTPEVAHCAYGHPDLNAYNGYARFLDSIVDEFDILLACSAGNYGWGYQFGVADCGNPYNALVVNALNMQDADSSRANTTLADPRIPNADSVGGWGPAADGRKKPDISVPVVYMYVQDSGGVFQWLSAATSIASPQVTGAGLLMMDLGVTNQRSIKALLLNTTFRPDDMTSAVWDTGWGWGMLDAEHARIHATQGDYFEGSVTNTETGDKRYYRGTFLPFDNDNNTYDRATLVWERHANFSYGDTNVTAKPLTNIDLFLFDGDTAELVASSTSTIDNVEQIYWNALDDTLHNAVLVVDCESNLPSGYSYEPFSLATEEGFTYYSAPKNLVGLTTENQSIGPPVIYQDYDVKYRVFFAGHATCDTIWPSLIVDQHTSIVAGPSPSHVEPALGDTATVTYTLVSSTLGPRTIAFSVEAACYRRRWAHSVNTTYSVIRDFDPGERRAARNPAYGETRIVAIDRTEQGLIIHFEASRTGESVMEVFDLRGRRVFDRQASIAAGEGALSWGYETNCGKRVASGVYVMRLRFGDASFTRRVVVFR